MSSVSIYLLCFSTNVPALIQMGGWLKCFTYGMVLHILHIIKKKMKGGVPLCHEPKRFMKKSLFVSQAKESRFGGGEKRATCIRAQDHLNSPSASNQTLLLTPDSDFMLTFATELRSIMLHKIGARAKAFGGGGGLHGSSVWHDLKTVQHAIRFCDRTPVCLIWQVSERGEHVCASRDCEKWGAILK